MKYIIGMAIALVIGWIMIKLPELFEPIETKNKKNHDDKQ